MNSYYYIYRVGGDAPKIKHTTLEEAERESLRLAEKHPNASFEILQCLGITRMSKPSTFWMDGVIPPHVCALNRAMDGTCFQCGESVADLSEDDIIDRSCQEAKASKKLFGLETPVRMLNSGEIIKDGDEFTRDCGKNWSASECIGDIYQPTIFNNIYRHHPHRRKVK